MISSELQELVEMSDRILVMSAGKQIEIFNPLNDTRETIMRAMIGNK